METVEQGGIEARAMAGTEAHTSQLPTHPQAARASAASQHPAAPMEHFPNFLQDVKMAVRSCSRPQAEELPFLSISNAPPAP